MANERHVKKDVQYTLEHAREEGMIVQIVHNGHLWGRVICPDCGQVIRVYCTPSNPSEHAKDIRRKVDRCITLHTAPTESDREEEDDDAV
jgi:hypothetical protein